MEGLNHETCLSQVHNCWSQCGMVYNVALESSSQRLGCCSDGERENLEEQCSHARMSTDKSPAGLVAHFKLRYQTPVLSHTVRRHRNKHALGSPSSQKQPGDKSVGNSQAVGRPTSGFDWRISDSSACIVDRD